MKKNNIAKIIWVLSLFLFLTIILIAVMDYKINFQYKTKNKIYFYECEGNLCVTEVENSDHLLYSKYECGYEECPVFSSTIDNTYALLATQNNKILFNYRNGKIISEDYEDYNLINNKYFIVSSKNKQGIIDQNNKLLIPTNYDELGYEKDNYLLGCTINYIIAQKQENYGIISIKTGNIIEEFTYKESDIETLLKILSDKEKEL